MKECEFCGGSIDDGKNNQVRHKECTRKYYRDFTYLVHIKRMSREDAIDKIRFKISRRNEYE